MYGSPAGMCCSDMSSLIQSALRRKQSARVCFHAAHNQDLCFTARHEPMTSAAERISRENPRTGTAERGALCTASLALAVARTTGFRIAEMPLRGRSSAGAGESTPQRTHTTSWH